MDSEERLIDRCIALEELIVAIKPFYSKISTTENQKAFIETVIGAGLWYFPHNKSHWNRKISKNAIQQIRENPNSRLTRDHVYPRKASGRKLLTEELNLSGEGIQLYNLYQNELAMFVAVTSEENRKLVEIQNNCEYGNWVEAYKKGGIILLDFDYLISVEDPQFIRILQSKI